MSVPVRLREKADDKDLFVSLIQRKYVMVKPSDIAESAVLLRLLADAYEALTDSGCGPWPGAGCPCCRVMSRIEKVAE